MSLGILSIPLILQSWIHHVWSREYMFLWIFEKGCYVLRVSSKQINVSRVVSRSFGKGDQPLLTHQKTMIPSKYIHGTYQAHPGYILRIPGITAQKFLPKLTQFRQFWGPQSMIDGFFSLKRKLIRVASSSAVAQKCWQSDHHIGSIFCRNHYCTVEVT